METPHKPILRERAKVNKNPKALLESAQQAYLARQYALARERIDAVLRERKPPPEAHLWAGLIDYQCGDLHAARKHYDAYLDLPGQPDRLRAIGLFNRAIVQDCAGEWDKAASDYVEAVALFRTGGQTEYVHQCYRNLAWTRCEQGRLDDAAKALEATEGHSTDAEAYWAQRTARAYLCTLRDDYAPIQELSEESEGGAPHEISCMVLALEALAFHRLGDEAGCVEALRQAHDILAVCWDPRCRRVISRVHTLRRVRNLS